jgi:hypothetical protein
MRTTRLQHLSPSANRNGQGSATGPWKGRRRTLMLSVLLVSGWCAAQEAPALAPDKRDSITLQSAYFSTDYANNVDYAQFVLEQSRGTERLAGWVYEKNREQLDTPIRRTAFFLGANVVSLLGNSFLPYHEWGHASRFEATGIKAEFFTSSAATERASARSFLGYAGNMVFKFSGATGIVGRTGIAKTNNESGNARGVIVDGAGMNNEIFLAERNDEQYFLKDNGAAFGIFNSVNRFAIAYYKKSDSPGNDMNNVAREYRLRGLDRKVQPDDLRKINLLSAFSGAVVSDVLARRDFIIDGKTDAQPWLIKGFLVPNHYNYLSSRGMTRKWVSGYAFNDSLKILGSYESVILGDDYSEFGLGAYKNFGTWDLYGKVTGKDFNTLNLEAAASLFIAKDWKLGVTAHAWDSRSLLGERHTLDISQNKTQQFNLTLSYLY